MSVNEAIWYRIPDSAPSNPRGPDTVRVDDDGPDGAVSGDSIGVPIRVPRRRALARRAVVVAVLEHAAREDWSATLTADVIVAQLAIGRRKRGIFGPCVYCDTWIASTVDHVTPTSRGGDDSPENHASACLACNGAKGGRTIEEWRGSLDAVIADRLKARALSIEDVDAAHAPDEVTPASAERLSGLPRGLIWALAQAGSIPSRFASGTLLVTVDHISNWMELEAEAQHADRIGVPGR